MGPAPNTSGPESAASLGGRSEESRPGARPDSGPLAWLRLRGDSLAAWALAFAAVAYLSLEDGGYDIVVSGEAGIVIWWAVLVLAVAGLLPRIGGLAWIAVGLLAGLAAWTAIGIGGSESQERTLAEVGRLATYTGVLALAVALRARGGVRPVVNGVAAAIGLITLLAVLSRLHPQAFPTNDHFEFLGAATRRLSDPLNYWNALAAFLAMGGVLLLGVCASARTWLGQGLAAATLPLTCLGIYLSVSRGGAIVLAIGVVAYLLLADDRLPKLAAIVVAGAGGGVLIAAASSREALKSGVDNVAARSEGAELIWIALAVCIVAAALQVAILRLARHAGRPRWTRIPRRHARIASAVAVPAILATLLLAGLPGELSDRWEAFKTPPAIAGEVTQSSVFARLEDSAGQGRYQYWQQSLDQYRTDKLSGTGGGTFALWWARHANVGGAVQDAHNLYVQTLGEIGLPGLLLLLAFVALTITAGVRGALRGDGETRALVAGVAAAIIVFWVDASVEWIWQMTVIPVTLLLLVAAVVPTRVAVRSPRIAPRAQHAIVAVACVVALTPIAIAMSVQVKVRDSQAAAQRGDLDTALADARTAQRVQPGAASPRLQQALVYEQAGQLDDALPLIRRATSMEPTNWKLWITQARIEARLGRARALDSFRQARRLNPESAVFDDRP